MAQPTMSTRHGGAVPGLVTALREQQGPSSSTGQDQQRDTNPFAPPPKGAPEQPWRPRRSARDGEGGEGGENEPQDARPGSGDRWSNQQPEPRRDGFGGPDGYGSRPGGGPGGGPGRQGGTGPRFDVTDPVQRRARYALLAGMWGLFFGLFSMPEIGLLLGALALYWGVSSLRGKAKQQDGEAAAAASPYVRVQQKPQFTAAVSGIIAGAMALAIVALTFSFQLVYQNYYTCLNDALTQPDRAACVNLLPEQVRPMLGSQDG
jgi:hypothetical protein